MAPLRHGWSLRRLLKMADQAALTPDTAGGRPDVALRRELSESAAALAALAAALDRALDEVVPAEVTAGPFAELSDRHARSILTTPGRVRSPLTRVSSKG